MDKEKALNRAAGLCSAGEHCEAEIAAKLQAWEVTDEDATEIMARLIGEGFIDDRRYASAFVHDRLLYSHWGRLKIAQGLRMKGVARQTIAEAMLRLDGDLADDYRRILSDTIAAKQRTLGEATDWQGEQLNRAKTMRHAAGRGFLPDEILALM